MKSLPRLALGAFFAGMLAVSSYATTQTWTLATWNTSGSAGQTWNVTVPSAVDITASISLTNDVAGGAGGTAAVARVGGGGGTFATITGWYSGTGTRFATNTVYDQPAGTYNINHAFGGPQGWVYGNLSSTLTW